ncbi:helix-turn-helix transcriptional regulator [Beijerinckia indica]|uniref:Transcriptional regulator, LuxR family n=1 Tax=Beijerinckia indica subsp. indica (strain ATCC 9039 / DSM 1715 / NCIMB 8712) TaxID=395963 RepID=B2IL02_BEII9|nr:LuxR family transcriptional regulator [Beijerinckia indica]ACB96542.1 transcriptional regulator, LuxR family [Beijerinckia indica subsp. indica ATCC 9039]
MVELGKYSLAHVVEYQRRIDSADSLCALSHLTEEMCLSLGFPWFTLIRGKQLAKRDDRSILLTSYPQDWVDHVLKEKRHLDDPVHFAASRLVNGLSWNEIGQYVTLNSRQIETLESARRHGLNTGFTIPLRLDGFENAMFSMAKRKANVITSEERLLACLVGSVTFARAHALVTADAGIFTPVHLSPRQVDCVALLAKGYSDFEIARQLGISPETVREYITKARRSYGVKRRFQLAILAVRDGYLDLDDISSQRR